MDPTALEQALLTVAARLDILVRWETFDGVFAQLRGRGGLCRLGGKQLIIGDASMSVIDRVGVLCEALSHVDTDGIAMLPLVREKIDRYRVRRGAVVKARPRHLKLVV